MNDDKVQSGDECPYCSEARIDWLVWQEEDEYIRCETCGKRYMLLADCDSVPPIREEVTCPSK